MNIPKGFKEITEDVDGVFVSTDEVVITGIPDEDDDNHNCDAMGCSSVSHVLYRLNLKEIEILNHKFEWLKKAIEICNDEKISPKELANLLNIHNDYSRTSI